MQRYSPNPEINAKIHTLQKLGVPPIPVAPKLNPKHPDGHRVESPEYKYRADKPEFISCNGERVQVSGDYCKITTTAVGCEMAPVRGEFVRLDSTLTPTGLFTGKNPSYLGWDGKHRKLNHGQFQKRMPTEQELKRWFCNPHTGIGTLGGHNGIDWIDFDAKNYPTQEDCDRDVQALLDRIGKPTLTEKTGSGGYRVAVIPTVKPTFTNFSTEPGGKHLGEALFAGRFTVLAPSKHPNGNYYKELCNANPVEVESLESIGLYPSKDENETQKRAEKRSRKRITQGVTPNTQNTTFSDPADNPWDIRNFAQFLEGYSERGDGWGYAKCPAHNGTSLTSFRVRLDTGEFKLWCGCDTKAVFKAAKELAERFGYKPEIKAFTPEHDKTITREQWLSKHKIQQKNKTLSDWIKQQFNRIGHKFSQGTGELPSTPQPNPKNTPDDSHIIYYPPGQRLEAWKQEIEKGKTYILDGSATGNGKSHDTGKILPEDFGVSRVIYATGDPRNVTTPTLKDWDRLEARHDGLVIDPNNNQIRRRKNWSDDRELLTPANCGRTKIIAVLRELNVSGADTSEKICKTCPHFDGCRAGVTQFDYLKARAEVLGGSSRIIAHPNSLPPLDSDFAYGAIRDGDKPDGGTLLVIEEAEETIKTTKDLSVKIKDIGDVQATLFDAQSWPVIGDSVHNFDPIGPILAKLKRLIKGEIKAQSRYGHDHHNLIEILGEYPAEIDSLLEPIRDLLNEDTLINRILDPYESEYGVSLEDLPRGVKRLLTEKDSEVAEKAATTLIKQQWLIAFLEIWKGSRNGYLSINRGVFTISIPERKTIDIINGSEYAVFLSATLTREQLALRLGCEPDAIAEVRQIEDEGAELEIIQIPDLGRLSKQRGKRQSDRVAATISELRSQEPNTKIIDFKKFCNSPDFLAWIRDSRGSNTAQYCLQLILTGTPVKNLTALAGEFTALYSRPPLPGTEKVTRHIKTVDGDHIEVTSNESVDLEFREFVRTDTVNNFTQAIGRLRANRRPGEKLKIYILSNFALDIPAQIARAVDIAVTAGSVFEQLIHYVKNTGLTGLRDVAAGMGKAASTISQLVKRKLGISWDEFITKLFCSHLLLEPINSKCEQPPPLDQLEAESFTAEAFELVAADDLIPELIDLVKVWGWDSWQRIVNQLPPAVKTKFIEQLALLLPDDLRELIAAG